MPQPSSNRLSRLWPYLVRHWRLFLPGAVFLVATNFLALRIPRNLGAAIQTLRDATVANAPIDFEQVKIHTIAIAALALGAGTTRVLSRILIFNGGRLVEYQVRNEVFDHLTRLDAATYGSQATGDLVSRCINDVTQIRLLFGVGILNLVNTAIAYLVVLTFMFGLSPRLALLSLMPYPFILLAMVGFTRALYSRSRAAQAQLSVLSSQAQEALSGVAVVKSFAIEPQISAQFRAASDEYVRRNLAVALVRGGLMPFMRVAAGVGTLIVVWFGGRAVIAGELEIGQFVEFSGYVVGLAWPTMALGWVLSVYNRGSAAFDRTTQILDLQPNVDPRAPGLEARPGAAEIRFEAVSLDYEDGTPALRDVDLTIAPGSSLAIVGTTGGGKTSLVHLLPRLRDPTAGRVLVGGVDIRELTLPSLRAMIGYVPQDGFLFSKTLGENVLLGVRDDDPDTRRETLDTAVRMAGLEPDLPALANGLSTIVGERGVTLSGGQRQRSTLARALATNPDILILDDALSAVDTKTERTILHSLADVMSNRTTLLVTHRYAALELVDRVVVIEGGRLIEQGTHSQLIAAGGRYAELVAKQELEAKASSFGEES
ncbi:MAG: ATP-binding cassette subfamily B protein [Bradymonadia bacterium]